jgi:F0F1-type ATP synthase assembly protein I
LTLGIVLDSIFATRPTLTLVFLFFGVIGSFYNLYKIVRNGIRID